MTIPTISERPLGENTPREVIERWQEPLCSACLEAALKHRAIDEDEIDRTSEAQRADLADLIYRRALADAEAGRGARSEPIITAVQQVHKRLSPDIRIAQAPDVPKLWRALWAIVADLHERPERIEILSSAERELVRHLPAIDAILIARERAESAARVELAEAIDGEYRSPRFESVYAEIYVEREAESHARKVAAAIEHARAPAVEFRPAAAPSPVDGPAPADPSLLDPSDKIPPPLKANK